MKYKLVIFDMDGTILNTLEDLADSMNYCLASFNMPTRSLDEIRQFVGSGAFKLVERSAIAGTDIKTVEKMFEEFSSYYKNHCNIKTMPYEGICNVIEGIRKLGCKTSVASNKPEYAVKALCDEIFPGLFDYCTGDIQERRVKPYPDMINDTLRHFNLKPCDAVYIGDSDVDFETAKNSGLDLILVDWGFRSHECLENLGDEIIVSTPDEILKILTD